MADSPGANAERGRLVHVEPDTRKLDARVRPIGKRLRPESSGILREPVREDLYMYACPDELYHCY